MKIDEGDYREIEYWHTDGILNGCSQLEESSVYF